MTTTDIMLLSGALPFPTFLPGCTEDKGSETKASENTFMRSFFDFMCVSAPRDRSDAWGVEIRGAKNHDASCDTDASSSVGPSLSPCTDAERVVVPKTTLSAVEGASGNRNNIINSIPASALRHRRHLINTVHSSLFPPTRAAKLVEVIAPARKDERQSKVIKG